MLIHLIRQPELGLCKKGATLTKLDVNWVQTSPPINHRGAELPPFIQGLGQKEFKVIYKAHLAKRRLLNIKKDAHCIVLGAVSSSCSYGGT